MPKNVRKQRFVNILGGLGYISCLLQWGWLAAIFLPPLFKNPGFKNFFVPEPSSTSHLQIFHANQDSPLIIGLALLVVFIVLTVTIVVIMRLPIRIAKAGSKALNTTSHAIIPIVTHHKKIPIKKQRLLDVKIIKLIKLIICLLPLVLLAFSPLLDVSLPTSIIVIVGAFLAVGSLVWFGAQYLLANALKIKPETLL